MIERFIDKDNVKDAKKEIMACEKKKDELILEYNPKYEDITEQFISEIDNNKKATIKDATSVVKNNKKYYVNDKNIIVHEFNEVPVGEWIKSFLHKDVEYLPNISEDDGIELGDYLIEKTEVWELKTIKGNGKRTLDSAIKEKREQANIFIFDMTYSKMNIDESIRQSQRIFGNREWVEKIIIKKNDDLIKVLIKK